MTRTEAPVERSPAPVVTAACVVELAFPGAGYLVLGRPGRAAVAFLGVAFLCGWGLALGGDLSRPESNQILSYLKTFACLGLGLGYVVLTRAGFVNYGLGDITRASHEYGGTFILAAGLVGFLLVLDVYDIGVGRRS